MENQMMVGKADMDHNIAILKNHIKVPMIAVVKMNGYGIGLQNAVSAWYKNGIRIFAVSYPEEAFSIIAYGYADIDILLMSPVYDQKIIERLILSDVILSIVSTKYAEAVSALAEKLNKRARVHVKIDIGMGRFGIKPKQSKELLELYQKNWLAFEGIYSHFPCAFEKKYKKTKKQLNNFKSVLTYLKSHHINPGMTHIANSCAAIRFPETWLDAVRIGSAMIGRLPVETTLPLKKVGLITVQVAEVKILEKGERIGYAQLYKARKNMKVAILPIGHRDGFGMTYQNDNCCLSSLVRSIYHDIKAFFMPQTLDLGDYRLPVVGRIGNQFTVFDISGKDIKVADILHANINTLLVNPELCRMLR